MARRALTRNLYDKMVEAFRECPGNASHAARIVGCDRRFTARGWKTGWKTYPWARPIKEVLQDESRLARARAADIERQARDKDDLEREKAQQYHVEALAQEQQMLKVARNDVLALLVIAAEQLPALRALGKVLAKRIDESIASGTGSLTTKAIMGILKDHSQLQQRAVKAAEQLIDLGRRERGQPGVILGAAPVDDDMSYAEALEELHHASDLAALVRERSSSERPLLVEHEAAPAE